MRAPAVLLLLAVGCGPKSPAPESAAGQAAPDPFAEMRTPDEIVDDAVDRIAAGDEASVRQAVGDLEGVVRRDPKHVAAQFNLGVARLRLGNAVDARDAFEIATTLAPDLTEAWLALGVVQEQTGQAAAAVDSYRAGIARDPENMDLRVALIGALRKMGRLDEANAEAKAALTINANSLAIYNNIGLAYIDAGDLDMAQFVYQKALGGIPGAETSAHIHGNLGWTFYKKGDVPTAQFYLERAVDLDPTLVPSLVYLARIYQENHNYTDMVPLLEAARARAPENLAVLMNLGIAYRGVGRFEEAKELYDAMIAREPGLADPWFNLGILHGDYLKDYDAGIRALQTYIDMGGPESQRAQSYIDDFEKERGRAERKRQKEAEATKKRTDLEERKRLVEEAESQPSPPSPDEEAPPDGAEPPVDEEVPPVDPQEEPPPADDTTDEPSEGDPWGEE